MSQRGPGGHVCPRDGPLAAQSQLPLASPLGNGLRKLYQTPGGHSATPLPTSPQGLLTMVVITTELHQTLTLEGGQATPQYSLGLQENIDTMGQKLGELPASASESRLIRTSQEGLWPR